MSEKTQYLTPDQVQQLNEKHGWFQYGDAQSDVSKAFAQDAIAMHERIRAAAPELLAALQEIVDVAERCDSWESLPDTPIEKAHAAIAKATGSQA